MATTFINKCFILGDLYSNYGQDKEFQDFIEFNDLGLPLAYLVSERLCEASDDGARFIDETWEMFLKAVELEDVGFEDLEDVFNAASNE